MSREKRRPTLDELRALPKEAWELEAAQIGVDAVMLDLRKIEDEAFILMDDPEITPEKVVALRERLQSATGSTPHGTPHGLVESAPLSA